MNAHTQAEIDALDAEYKSYIKELRSTWLARNRVRSKNVYEVMSEEEREKVHQCIGSWKRYITPLSEAWWQERGFGVMWPDDDSEPMKVHKLEAA